jgi:hypothetical protein
MGKYGQGFVKTFFCTVIFVFLLGSTCFASEQEVLQFKAIVPVTGTETNATVSLELGSKVILDASENAIAGTYSWVYLGGPSEIRLWNKNTPSAYFWSEKPGVYRFELNITQDGTVIETRNVFVIMRNLHYININEPKIENEMDIGTYSIAYPLEWIALNAVSDKIGALTTTESIVDIKGNASPHTVTLQCKNLATGAQYTASTFLKENNLEFSFSGVVLQEGDNIIEVTGIDDLGVTCRDARFITYNPSITFLEQLRLFPKYEGDNLVNVKFSLQAKPVEENTVPEKFELYETTVSGDILHKIAELKPDNTASQGTYSTT